jgi:hypothetical protein
MSNPFASFAEDTKPAWQRRKERIADGRRSRSQERLAKAEEEQRNIDRVAAAMRKARLEELMSGPNGAHIRALRSYLRVMTIDSAPELIEYVTRSKWLRTADADTRYDVLGMISRGITSLRLRNGLEPFDDGLWDEEPSAFVIIREMLR